MDIQVQQHTVHFHFFANDQVVITHDYDDAQNMTRKLIGELTKWELTLNMTETQYLTIEGTFENLILKHNVTIKNVTEFKYLRFMIDNLGNCANDIKIKTA